MPSNTAPQPQTRTEDRRQAPAATVVIPTFNEAGNIVPLLEGIATSLADTHHEVIVVDDNSPDRTWERAEEYANTHPSVQVIRRFGETGLSSAVVAGMEVSKGNVIAVIDGDGQHDESALGEMIEKVSNGTADVVVGTRASEGGSYGEFSAMRRLISWCAALIAKLFLRVPVSDPMSGYFAISRETFNRVAPTINPQGFKILLEFIGRRDDLKIAEVGYTFRRRQYGETKLSPSVIRSYLLAVFELRFGRQVKGQFFMYALVGFSGMLINLAVFAICEAIGLPSFDSGISELIDPVEWSVLLGIQTSIVTNFLANNYFTFWEFRFRRRSLLFGFALFQAVSTFGLVIHLGVFHFLQSTGYGFKVVGEDNARWIHNLMGLATALISNYFLNVNYTWRRRAQKTQA